jgi:hypothetical protein
MDRKEVLCHSEIHGAVPVEIGNSYPEYRGPLRFHGKGAGIKSVPEVQQDH